MNLRNITKKRLCAVVLAGLILGFVILNILSYNHAGAMMQFTPAGARTRKIENLTFPGKVGVLFTGVTMPRPETHGKPKSPYEEISITCSNGVVLAAWYLPVQGNGPLVLMFHGYSAEKSSVLEEAEAFRALGCPVMLIDFRGSGDSSEDYTTIGVLEGEDAAEALAYARERWPDREIVLYGISMGAAAILRSIDSYGAQPDGIILEAVFDTMLRTVCNRFDAMGLPSFPCAQLLVFWGGARYGFNGFRHNPVEYAESVVCPALVMHGSDDPRAKVEEGRRVYEAIPDGAVWHEFAGIGHQSYVAARPEEWAKTVSTFLNERETDNPPAMREHGD